MANSLSPTAANIISSLGIKGATGSVPVGQGPSFYGYVPILNENGKLDSSFISYESAAGSVSPFRNAAIVDCGTEIGDGNRNGSVSAPFKTLSEAASRLIPDSTGSIALIVMPGTYQDINVSFSGSPSHVFIVCVGDVMTDNDMVIRGIRGSLSIQGLNISAAITVGGCSSVEFLGGTNIGSNVNIGDAIAYLSSEVSGDIASKLHAADVKWISGAYRIGFGQDGSTVGSAIDTLSLRTIKISDISAGQDGISTVNTREIHAENGTYDLTGVMGGIASAINSMFQNGKFSSIEVTGLAKIGSVEATTIKTNELNMDSLLMGGYRIAIDSFGYLIVLNGSDTPPETPDGFYILIDRDTNEPYIFGVSGGRVYLERADQESDGPTPVDSLEINDGPNVYSVYVEDGRLFIDRGEP